VSTVWKFWESVLQIIQPNGFYVVLFLLLGAFIGFAITYKYPLDVTSQNLLTLTLRLIALILILTGTNNYLGSLIIVFFIVTLNLWVRLLRFFCCCGASSDPDDIGDSDNQISSSYPSPHRRRHSGSDDNSCSQDNVPYNRTARKHYLAKKLDPQKLALFHVSGADEYITPQQYQEETEANTELELAKLKQDILRGKYSQGDWVAKLSVPAQQRMKSWLTEPSEDDYDE